MTQGVYAIEHVATGKLYIGESTEVESRWNRHRNLLNAGKHSVKSLQSDWVTFGASAFQLLFLEEVSDSIYLQRQEQHHLGIRWLATGNHGYNTHAAKLVEATVTVAQAKLKRAAVTS